MCLACLNERLLQQESNILRLAGADLENDAPGADARQAGDDAAIEVEPVLAAVEGAAGIVSAHFRTQSGDVGARDVRRVADNKVERPLDAVQHVGLRE